LLAANEAECRGSLTVADLFGRFERDVISHEDWRQAAEDRRRIAVWTAHLGGGREMESVDRATLERAEEAARQAAIKRDDPEAAALLAPLEGSDFHAYRRAWATARKHLPLKDVAETGGWRSTETLLRCYTQADEATMLAVVCEMRKVRAAGAKP
jgi:hypothetical protein